MGQAAPGASPATTYSVFTADGSIARRADPVRLGHPEVAKSALTKRAFSWKFTYRIVYTRALNWRVDAPNGSQAAQHLSPPRSHLAFFCNRPVERARLGKVLLS